MKLENFVIRGSSSGLYRNGEFVGTADNNCPRRTLLRFLNIQEEVDEKTKLVFALGAQFETYYRHTLDNPVCEMEVKIGNFTGHVDFMTPDGILHETKSISSLNTLKTVKKGVPKVSHVVQLVGYLIALEKEQGKLVYGDYTSYIQYKQFSEASPEWIKSRLEGAIPVLYEFDIAITEDGFVHVNGKSFENLHVTEFLEFQEQVTSYIANDELPPRIESLNNDWGSDPCKYCKFAMLCDSNPSTIDDFVEGAQEVVEALALEV